MGRQRLLTQAQDPVRQKTASVENEGRGEREEGGGGGGGEGEAEKTRGVRDGC